MVLVPSKTLSPAFWIAFTPGCPKDVVGRPLTPGSSAEAMGAAAISRAPASIAPPSNELERLFLYVDIGFLPLVANNLSEE